MSDTVVRAVTMPVECPVTCGWGELNEALRTAFALSTDLANWAVHYLFRRDAPGAATPDAVKPGKASEPGKAYLYGAAVKEFPDWAVRCAGVASNAQCVFRAVHKKYLQDRFAVQVRHESSLLTYRFPYPFPVHNANWSVHLAKGPWPGEAPVVVLPLPGPGRAHLKLARGPEWGRQLAMLRQFIGGTAKKGEAAVLRDRKGRLLVKLVGHFPRKERGEAANVCFLHTDPNALLVAEVNGRSVTVTNADHLKRAHAVIRGTHARHKAFLQRAREDKKREVRMDRAERSRLNAAVEARCDKQRRRIDTAVKQIAAQVARFLGRQRVGLVAYDDAVKSFLPDGFPWHALKTRVRQLFEGEMGGDWVEGGYASLTHTERDAWLARTRATALAGARAVAHARRKGSHPAVTANSPPTPSRPRKTSRGSARR